MNGTPWPNALDRLHTGPSDRNPASYQSSSASSPGSIASAPSRCRTATGGPSAATGTVEVADPPRHADRAGPLDRQQPPPDGGGVRGGDRVLDRGRQLDLDHAVIAGHEPCVVRALGLGEHREDPAAHASGVHARKVEVPALPARDQQRMIVPGQGIVVPVEHRRLGGH